MDSSEVVVNPKESSNEEESKDFGEKEMESSKVVGNPTDSTLGTAESSIAPENHKRFKEEMDILLLIESCVMDAKLGNHESANIAILTKTLQIDQKQSANVIKTYQKKFQKLWDNIDTLIKFQNNNSLNAMEISVWRHNTGKDMPPWALDLIHWERVIEHSNPEDFAKQFASIFTTPPLLS